MLPSLSLGLVALIAAAQLETGARGARPGRVVLVAAAPAIDARASTDPTSRAVVLALEAPPAEGVTNTAGAPVHMVTRAVESDAEDRALAEVLHGASAIELREGTWLGWHHAAHSNRHELEWVRALRRAHARGAEVRASGGAAAWISSWSPVPRAILDKAAQVPHDTSLDLPVEGLGLFDGPLVGVLTPGAPTADRVVERALAFGYGDVLLLAGEAEFAWDPATRTARVTIPSPAADAGSAWIAWLDLGAGKRSRAAVRDARATILRDGDVYAARTRTLAGGARTLEDARDEPSDDAAVARLRRELGGAPGETARAGGAVPSRIGNIRISRDERTFRSARGGLTGILLDLEIQNP